jgi:hypothetical protein
MHPRLKNIIFGKLSNDLKNVEIIHLGDLIWFVDREKEYWYLEYQKNNGLLYYCDKFFRNFFLLFSIECNEYKNIIKDFVEMVLTFEVKNIYIRYYQSITELNDVLNETLNLESVKINLLNSNNLIWQMTI